LQCTFGVWNKGALLPVGKASADEHKDAISRHASAHALKRFGPTTQVEHSDKAALLLDISFEGVSASRRHKAGLTLQAPRITGVNSSHALDDVASLEELTTRLPHI
jgi:DNA ligase-1